MDNFSLIINWHPGYYISRQTEDRLLLIGETESFLLQGWQFQELFRHIDGQQSILDMMSHVSSFGKKAILLNAIEELLGKGLIRTKNGDNQINTYYQSDYDSKPRMYHSHKGKVLLWNLSAFDDPEFIVQWAERISVDHPMGIVITDDYLDPRLKEINRLHIEENRPWLLLKPAGKQPLIGPFFTPDKPMTPCLECLTFRMIHNQPVRQWFQNDLGNGTLRIPVCHNHETVKKVMASALEPALELIAQQKNNQLLAISPETLLFNRHFISVIPQCQCCGDPGITSIRNQQPITLQPCPKVHISDGGVRSFLPMATIERLQTSISPITGIIGEISLLPGQRGKGVPIYRSFFFKTPGSGVKPDNHAFVQISLGKGLSDEQSQASALCESLERHAVQYRGDEYMTVFPVRGSDIPAIPPQQLAAYSDRQYRNFDDGRHPESKAHYAVETYHPETPLTWTRAWSLADGTPCHVPLAYCYANTPLHDQRFSRFNSNGCAAGNTLEEALLQGFLELVERDAAAIWWYNRIPRPRVSLQMLSDENRGTIDQSLNENWEYWVLDLTHDIGIPVMAAVARHKTDHSYRLGFGCHINPVLACQRSLTELCQLIAINGKGGRFDFKRIEADPFLSPIDTLAPKKQSDYIAAKHADMKNDIHYCVDKMKQLGLTTLAINYTRPDIPIHTVRVMVPGLCHIWPQLGNRRLYNVPVQMEWIQMESDEDRLNPMPLLL